MLQFELWKKVLIVLAVLAGIIFALPNFFRDGALPGALPQDSVNLGLDLQGGAHVLVEADMPPVFVEKAEETAQAGLAAMIISLPLMKAARLSNSACLRKPSQS